MKFVSLFVLIFGMAAMIGQTEADTVTTHTLLNQNTITVTESTVTCKNDKPTTVTTKVTGELYILSSTRTNFSGDKWKKRMAELDRETDDERGHVVASAFGGPIESWNLVPQHKSVNRKINDQNSMLNRWEEFERWARDQLGKKNGSPVKFTINVFYAITNGCRPIAFKIEASSKADTVGLLSEFDNGPHGSFAVSSKRT